jgi:hypothetical protein
MEKNIKYVAAEDRMGDTHWNNFWPDAWGRAKEVLRTFSFKPLEFVDITPTGEEKLDKYNSLNYWKNTDDTIVFKLNFKSVHGKSNPLALVQIMLDIHPEEFSYIEIAPDEYIIRLWWD